MAPRAGSPIAAAAAVRDPVTARRRPPAVSAAALSIPATGGEAAGILRIARGRTRDGELAAYVEDVRAGTLEDMARAGGPLELFLATGEPDEFVTFSVWAAWSDIERATGSDIQRPVATRQPERIVDWQVEHYECLPDLARPPRTAIGAGLDQPAG